MITYLSKSAGGRWFSYLLGLILDKIPVQSVASVADVGCGVGAKTARMAKYFTKAAVTGYDFSEAGIAAAKKYYRIENLHFATEDITESEYKTKFDVITAFDILEHVDVPNPDDAVATECEFAVADFVGLAFRVLAAVYFDDQAPLAADKVDIVASDRLLADEFEPIGLVDSGDAAKGALRLGSYCAARFGHDWCLAG